MAGKMKKALTLLILLLASCGPPDPEPLYEVTFQSTNALGVELPWFKAEPKVYRTKTRPIRTGILGGTRFSWNDEFGNLGELKGSYDFQVTQIGEILYTDPRHSKYEPND